ncbi:MAG: MBL fold metallo-hydrolase [Candidatus Adiutrix sp.]|jgi:metallo-beta-lactamase family protein|nr:MBL fold metallo-hydrolase [Candidatus Adiutrix sp.]
MKIKALGAVATVTGSCFRLEMDSGARVLLDCGLFQGGRQTELRNFDTAVYDPQNVTAIVITHAHMDHSGLAPRLVKAGYTGPIYATEPTCDLLRPLWLDGANIQEQEAIWKSRKNRRQGRRGVEPLYREEDARQAMTRLTPLAFQAEREIVPGLRLTCYPAGHILGAASAHFTIQETGGRGQRISFSGDIGRTGQLLLPDPTKLPETDTLFMETTYGNRLHKDMGPSVDEFLVVVNQAYREGGKILIPAFAVERTQEIMLLLARAWHDQRLPREMPIILDSPLAAQTLEVYAHYTHLFDETTRSFLARGLSLETLPSLRITKDALESQRLNDIKGPALIIAGSGMANAGRILHHLKHNLWRPNCHVIFVGFQAQGTTGRRLVEGAKVVKIFREAVQVAAQIHTIGGFSGHADQKELLAWLGRLVHPGLTVNLIHGEMVSTRNFYDLARATYPEVNFHIPDWLRYVALADQSPGPEVAQAAADSLPAPAAGRLAPSFISQLDRLGGLAANVAQLPPDRLAQVEDYLARAENLLMGWAAETEV